MAARSPGIKFLRLGPSSTFISFIESITNKNTGNHNRRAFALAKQSDILVEFEKQLKEIHAHDPGIVQKRMQQVSNYIRLYEAYQADTDAVEARSPASQARWKYLQRGLSYLVKQRDDAGETGALDLPKIGRAHGATHDVFEKQTYVDFAAKARQRNADYPFTRETMDQAFTLAAQMAKKKVNKTQPAQFDRMMARCLGKQSEEYWKKQ